MRLGKHMMVVVLGMLLVLPLALHAHAMAEPSMDEMDMVAPLLELHGEDFDVAFMSMMIAHHEGAIEMSEWILERTDKPELIETAEAISEHTGLRPTTIAELREVGNTPNQRADRPRERASFVVTRWITLHGRRNDRVAVVTHMGFLDILVKTILNMSHDNRYLFPAHNAAATRIDLDGDYVQIVFANRTEHLPPDAVT